MSNPVRIDLIPRTIPVDAGTLAERAEAVQRLAELGQVDDPAAGKVATTRQGWFVTIGGAEVEVIDYAVSRPETGTQVAVSLVLAADSIVIGDPTTGNPQTQTRLSTLEEKKQSGWGSGNVQAVQG